MVTVIARLANTLEDQDHLDKAMVLLGVVVQDARLHYLLQFTSCSFEIPKFLMVLF
jgi:hypothetical protein